MHLAGVVADRDIFARHERMGTEPIAGFVVIFGGIVIIENPLRMFRPARFVQQMPGLFLATPEPAHAAIVAMLAPERRIDMAALVERSYKFVAVAGRAISK